MSDIIDNPNTNWFDTEDCPKNDLGYLLTDLFEILCDENGNRLLVHNGDMECKPSPTWTPIL